MEKVKDRARKMEDRRAEGGHRFDENWSPWVGELVENGGPRQTSTQYPVLTFANRAARAEVVPRIDALAKKKRNPAPSTEYGVLSTEYGALGTVY